jgi:trehalose 6-phosphate phosphatase
MTPADWPELAADGTALIFDFDGTLVPFGGGRDAGPWMATDLPELLMRAQARLNGALAIVTGRAIVELDSLIAPARLAVSGTHGAEVRPAPGAARSVEADGGDLPALTADLVAWAADKPGVIVLEKPLSTVIIYHERPELEADILALADTVTAAHPGFRPEPQRRLLEIKPEGADKGRGINRLMAEPVFSGRRPVFFGDDLPDEAGFVAVNALGGVSVKVGTGETAATHRFASPDVVLDWLRRFVA